MTQCIKNSRSFPGDPRNVFLMIADTLIERSISMGGDDSVTGSFEVGYTHRNYYFLQSEEGLPVKAFHMLHLTGTVGHTEYLPRPLVLTAGIGLSSYQDSSNPPLNHNVYDLGVGFRGFSRTWGKPVFHMGLDIDFFPFVYGMDVVGPNSLGVPESTDAFGSTVRFSAKLVCSGSQKFHTCLKIAAELSGQLDLKEPPVIRTMIALEGSYGDFDASQTKRDHWSGPVAAIVGGEALSLIGINAASYGQGVDEVPATAGKGSLVRVGSGALLAIPKGLLLASSGEKPAYFVPPALVTMVSGAIKLTLGRNQIFNPRTNFALEQAGVTDLALAPSVLLVKLLARSSPLECNPGDNAEHAKACGKIETLAGENALLMKIAVPLAIAGALIGTGFAVGEDSPTGGGLISAGAGVAVTPLAFAF